MARLRQALAVTTKRLRIAMHEDALVHRELTARRRAEHIARLQAGVSGGPAPSYPLN
jgi:hypothetical protein